MTQAAARRRSRRRPGRRRGARSARRGRLWRRLRRLAALAALCGVLLWAVDRGFGPVIRAFCTAQARFLAVTVINQAIEQELARAPVSYDELVHLTRGADGQVLSLEMDTAALNGVSSRLTLAANAALGRLQLRKVTVPLGTVLGLQWLAGRGPGIAFYLQPTSYVEASFHNELAGAALNQTMHSVVLRMSVSVESFCAGYHTLQTVYSDMMLAQTVIVGEVPQMYWPN